LIKTEMKQTFLILYITLLPQCILAQTIITIKGVVKDAESGEGLPFASVGIKNESLGTATNGKGSFVFSFPDTYKNDSLIFSFIGYESISVKIEDSLIIRMKKSLVHLSEVMVYPLSATDYL